MNQEEYNKILTIIPEGFPSIEIFHLTDQHTSLITALSELAQINRYGYDLETIDSNLLAQLSTEYQIPKIRLFDPNKARYNRHAKLYDYLFLTVDLRQMPDQKLFLQKIYTIIKNGGKLLIFYPDSKESEALLKNLEEKNFVAINAITDTIEGCQVITAQKMHGWGS